MMYYKKLVFTTEKAMNELEQYINKYELTDVLESIQIQLSFIQKTTHYT